MSELIVVDLVIFALLIMIATVIVVTRGRRSSRRASAPRGTAAEPAVATTYPREPITPGLHADPVPPDPTAYEPAEPEQAEPEQAEPRRAEPEPAEPERAALEEAEPGRAAPGEAEQAEPERAEQPQADEVATADPGQNGSAVQPAGPAAQPGGQPGDAQPVIGSEPIGSYYEGADQPIADYLAERGWPQEPGTHDPARHA